MKRILLVGCIALAGCAGQPAVEPEPRTVRVEVPVPVPVHCGLAAIPEPAWAASELKRSDSLEVKVRALLAERRQRIGYERELHTAITMCNSQDSAQLPRLVRTN